MLLQCRLELMRLLCRVGQLDVRMAKVYGLVWETVEASAGAAVMQLVQRDLRCMESWRRAYAERRETCREGEGDTCRLCVRRSHEVGLVECRLGLKIWLVKCTWASC